MRNNLVSKIAMAYNSMGREQRAQRPGTDEEIQNPELDRAFDAIVEANKTKLARSSAVVLPLPLRPGLAQETAAQQMAPETEDACPECGHHHAEDDGYCARCGTLVQQSTALEPSNTQRLGTSLRAGEPGRSQPFHSCHCCNDRKQSSLLLAIILLLTFIAWQEWQQAHPAADTRAGAPVSAAPSAPPAQPAQHPTSPGVTLPDIRAHAANGGADRATQKAAPEPRHRRALRRDSVEADPEIIWHIPPRQAAQE